MGRGRPAALLTLLACHGAVLGSGLGSLSGPSTQAQHCNGRAGEGWVSVQCARGPAGLPRWREGRLRSLVLTGRCHQTKHGATLNGLLLGLRLHHHLLPTGGLHLGGSRLQHTGDINQRFGSWHNRNRNGRHDGFLPDPPRAWTHHEGLRAQGLHDNNQYVMQR
jgi:hypothetical protein